MKLFVTDLDGTMFTKINGLNEREQSRLQKLIDDGMPLTFATGRVIPSGLSALGNPKFKLPLIGHGGAVMQYQDSEVLLQESINQSWVPEAIDFLKNIGAGLSLALTPDEEHGRFWWQPENFGLMDEFIASREHDLSFRRLPDDLDVSSLQVISMSCCGYKDVMNKIIAWAETKEDLELEVVSDPYQKDVLVGFLLRKGVSKGRAIAVLCEKMGISPNDVTVFGDGENDISMFEMAGRTVAPVSACKSLLETADVILDRGVSVLDYLEREAAK